MPESKNHLEWKFGEDEVKTATVYNKVNNAIAAQKNIEAKNAADREAKAKETKAKETKVREDAVREDAVIEIKVAENEELNISNALADGIEVLVKGFIAKLNQETFTDKQLAIISEKTGFRIEDLQAVGRVCAANETLVGFRPISKISRLRLLQGAAGKGADIKGKSADQGVIEGLVPVNQAFSKLGTINDEVNVKYYTHLNHEKLEKDEARLRELQTRQDHSSTESEKLKFLTTKVHYEHDGKKVYGILQANGMAALDINSRMIFCYKNEQGQLVNFADGEIYNLEEGQKEEKVEVMAYQRLELEKEDHQGEEIKSDKKLVTHLNVLKPQMVTADADQLVTGTGLPNEGKIYNNAEGSKHSPVSLATDTGHTVTISLAVATALNNLVSHSAETFNPCPEKWSKGNYVFFVPCEDSLGRNDVNIEIAHTEEEVLEIYNRMLKKGYSMPINPEWGWCFDEKRQLIIAPDRDVAQERYVQLLLIKEEKMELELALNSCERHQYQDISEILKRVTKKYDDAKNLDCAMREINKQRIDLSKNYEERQRLIKTGYAELFKLEEAFLKNHNCRVPTAISRDSEVREAYPSEEKQDSFVVGKENNEWQESKDVAVTPSKSYSASCFVTPEGRDSALASPPSIKRQKLSARAEVSGLLGEMLSAEWNVKNEGAKYQDFIRRGRMIDGLGEGNQPSAGTPSR